MTKYPILIFDYDGTLHNCIVIYAPAFRRVYASMVANGLAPLRNFSDEEISQWLGWGSKAMWDAFAPDLPLQIKKELGEAIGQNMLFSIKNGEAQLYSDALQTLQVLKDAGYSMIFLSNCQHDYMVAHKDAFGLDRYFDGFYCTQDYDFAPKTEVFNFIKQDFNNATGFVAIGDRFHDMELVSVHGLKSIGCLYGFGAEGELDIATECVDDISQVPKVLSRWYGAPVFSAQN